MLSFESDYVNGAHPEVLKALIDTNDEVISGYGNDRFWNSAAQKIRTACACEQAQVYFLTGGTQTNQVVISTLLRPYEGVIAATTGHVNGHEAGAIEYSGHKVLTLPHHDGCIDADELRAYIQAFYADGSHDHMVFPGMVYISHPTEYGTLYTKEQLTAISAVCREYDIPLFLDGARLGYGLMSPDTDVTLPDLAQLCDVFYIGGTKVGALCGEAVVFTRGNMPKQFATMVKQHGAMLAKGRLTGVQFDALFTDDLYQRIGAHAIRMAQLLKAAFAEKGYEFFLQSPTNQQFVILDNDTLKRLQGQVKFSVWEPLDEHRTVARFVTSWSTREEDIAALRVLI
ncbi:MAG: low specificity L-threonine aldolase [Clostridia bacterium]|nr:low specificity L-threonine aldolase [Clostridia bacterium]